MSGRVVVVGGGLAGISAAVSLADAGAAVTLLESRPRLGGRACSFSRPGLQADTGTHVILRCYTQYRALLSRLGVADLMPIQPRMEIPVLYGPGEAARLRRLGGVPAPLHLLGALARYRALTGPERLRAARAAVALRGVDPADPRADAVRFGDWLDRHGQTAGAVRRLWGMITTAALNIDPPDASLALAAKVFRTGLLSHADAGDIGIPDAPLGRLHDEPARRLLAALGVDVRLGIRVTGIRCGGSGFVLDTRRSGDRSESGLHTGGLVLAVPHDQAAALVPAAAAPGAAHWEKLGHSPIVNVHLHFDRPVTDLPFAATPDSPIQWVFDRTGPAGVARGQYLVTSVSAADSAIGQPAQVLITSQVSALEAVFPASARAELLTAFVTREPRATFRQAAGTGRYRPRASTAHPALALAGAWTATGWPDTLEGAVRSGTAAARVLLGGHQVSTGGEAGGPVPGPDPRPGLDADCSSGPGPGPAGPRTVDLEPAPVTAHPLRTQEALR